MPTTITLKNIPDAVYEHLKKAAHAHHRSLNSEAIACLERLLVPTQVPAAERIARARKLRNGLEGPFDPEEISAAIKQGRP